MIGARFVIQQDLPAVLRYHTAAFEAIGGSPRDILYDPMKTAVVGQAETDGIVYNRALVDLARHYGLHPPVLGTTAPPLGQAPRRQGL